MKTAWLPLFHYSAQTHRHSGNQRELGVGLENSTAYVGIFSVEENAQMFVVKKAFDTKELLNPGKMSHPDLPRI